MKLKNGYLMLSLVGFALPYYFLISFLTAYGFDGKEFLRQLFGAPISAFFAVDLIVSSVVFLVYLLQDSRRYAVRHKWVYLVVLFTVGLSCAMPLFLYAREDQPQQSV